eukprot:2112274-Pleurochrysis_carterae.AAC.1
MPRGRGGAISANYHLFPHAVDSTILEVATAGPVTGRRQGVLVQRGLVVLVVLVSKLQQLLVA